MGMIVLIAGLLHTPLPVPDFHNIRHHDGSGEVCEFHDHLLRWHPGAGRADDVALLHWHWFIPASDPSDPATDGDGAAVHAHVVDWQAVSWEGPPQVSADTTARGLVPASSSPAFASTILAGPSSPPPFVPGRRPLRTFGATFAPRTSLACLLQRWTC